MYYVRDSQLEQLLSKRYADYKSTGASGVSKSAGCNYGSVFRGIPISEINSYLHLVNGSQRYYIMYRGSRKGTTGYSTPRRNAHSFDVYKRNDSEVAELRLEKIRYLEDRNEFLVYFESDDILRLKDEIRELKAKLNSIKVLSNA
jgi:hypothetical protein